MTTDLTDYGPNATFTKDTLEVAYRSTVEDFDLDRAVSDLARLRAVKQALALWEAELTEWIAEAVGRNTITVEGVGTVEVKRGNTRKSWDNDALIRLVIARGRDDRAVSPDGEPLESEGEAVGRVLMACARPSWRVTELRALGIDPDEYCSTSPGRQSVVIS